MKAQSQIVIKLMGVETNGERPARIVTIDEKHKPDGPSAMAAAECACRAFKAAEIRRGLALVIWRDIVWLFKSEPDPKNPDMNNMTAVTSEPNAVADFERMFPMDEGLLGPAKSVMSRMPNISAVRHGKRS